MIHFAESQIFINHDTVISYVVARKCLTGGRAQYKLSEGDKAAVERIEARQRDFPRRKLREAAQLPDIDADELVILWDIEYREGGDTIALWESCGLEGAVVL